MNTCNILILSVGRRVELVNCFKHAIKKLNIKSIIVGGDCEDTAPALYFVDRACILPRILSPCYIENIINTCNDNEIALIIPTIDTDLMTLSRNKEKIENQTNAKVLISDRSVIEICRDKINTQKFLEANNFKVPHMYSIDELDHSSELIYPLFIKPKDGSSSINAFRVDNIDELHFYRGFISNFVVQDFIEGEEFTVDTFLDFDCNIISVVPRVRLATRSGEVSKARIIKDREIITEVKRLLMILKPIGNITVQCMKTKRGIEFIEINPRIGGGAPMSIASGADSCDNLLRLLMGEKLVYNEEYKDNLLFLRFDSSICLNENMEVIKHLY